MTELNENRKLLINQNDTIFNAMKRMNLTGYVCLIVVDKFKTKRYNY